MNLSGPGGVLTGALALIALDVLATSTGSSGGLSNAGSLFTYPAQLAAKWMSPTIALIPGRQSGAAEASTTPAAGTQSGSTQLSTLGHPS